MNTKQMVAEKQSSFHAPGPAVALMLTRVPNQPGPTVFHIVWEDVPWWFRWLWQTPCCEDDFSHLFIWRAHGTTVFVPSIVFFLSWRWKAFPVGIFKNLSSTTSHQVFLLNFWAYLETICWDCCQDLSEWSFTTRLCFCIAVSIYHTYSQEWRLHSSGAIIKNLEFVNAVSVLLLKASVH